MVFHPGKYFVGTLVRVTAHFEWDDTCVDVDPTTVKVRFMSPSGKETTYTHDTDSEIGKSSTGDYFADFTPDESGRWHYRFQTTGTGMTFAIEDTFLVQYSRFEEGSQDAYST